MGIRTRAFLFCVALLTCAQAALALRVLVVRPAPSDAALFEAFGRLRAELALQGFDVVVLENADTPIDTDVLEVEAQSRDAFAAVALQREAGSTTAKVHIVDRVTGKTVTRKLKISSGQDGPMLLAIRSADLLRASLLELRPGEQPPPDVVGAERKAPPSEVVRFAHEPPHLQVVVGGAALGHPDLGFSFGTTVGLLSRPIPRLSLGVEFSGPAFGGEYQTTDGVATVRQEFGIVRGAWNLGDLQSGRHWEWGPLIGVGVAHIDARGRVEPPLVSQSRDLWAFAVVGGGHLDAFLSESVSMGVEASCLGLVPQPVVAVAEDRSTPLSVQGVVSLRLGVAF